MKLCIFKDQELVLLLKQKYSSFASYCLIDKQFTVPIFAVYLNISNKNREFWMFVRNCHVKCSVKQKSQIHDCINLVVLLQTVDINFIYCNAGSQWFSTDALFRRYTSLWGWKLVGVFFCCGASIKVCVKCARTVYKRNWGRGHDNSLFFYE